VSLIFADHLWLDAAIVERADKLWRSMDPEKAQYLEREFPEVRDMIRMMLRH